MVTLQIGIRTFPSKSAALKFVRAVLHATPTGDIVGAQGYNLLLDLLEIAFHDARAVLKIIHKRENSRLGAGAAF